MKNEREVYVDDRWNERILGPWKYKRIHTISSRPKETENKWIDYAKTENIDVRRERDQLSKLYIYI